MRLQTKLFHLHEILSKDIKKKALSLVEEESEQLKTYQKDQKKFNKRPFTVTTQKKMYETILNSQIIFMADFHTFYKNVFNLEKVLEFLLDHEKKVILCLEMIEHQHQDYLNQFIRGDISEIKFLELICYEKSWRFPWKHYQKLFSSARKEKKYSLLGLNSVGSLKERDELASEILEKTLKDDPDATLLVLFGELHLLPDKLPFKTNYKYQSHYAKPLRYTIVHQNIDEVYAQMGRLNRNKKILKFNNQEYIIQSAHSWLKYESMLHWYEHFGEDPDYDIHECLLTNPLHNYGENTHEDFLQICKRIINSLKLNKLKYYHLDNFNLHDYQNIDFLGHHIEKMDDSYFKKLSYYLLKNGRPFKIINTNIYCTTNYSMTSLAYLSGLHIFTIMNLENDKNYEMDILKSTQEKKFLVFFHMTMMAFFCAKYINPHIRSLKMTELNEKKR